MDRGVWALVLAATVLVAACTAAGTSPSGHAAKAAARIATPKPYTTVSVANSLAVKGSGSGSSAAATLKGDYVLTTSVKTKKGCAWSVRLQGPTTAVLDSGAARKNATHRLTVNTLGVVQGDYRLVVKASKCGPWSAALKRP